MFCNYLIRNYVYKVIRFSLGTSMSIFVNLSCKLIFTNHTRLFYVVVFLNV